jgi:hypothetical protein
MRIFNESRRLHDRPLDPGPRFPRVQFTAIRINITGLAAGKCITTGKTWDSKRNQT